jgi:site-specific recombinase
MSPDNQEMMRLMESLHDSMKREMHEGFAAVNARVDQVIARLDRIETRLDRQGSLIQIGARWTTRMVEWSERVDKLLGDRDQRMDEFQRRLNDLEHPQT